ncbi:unnamed protein product [Heterotrigona itama]|uniref:Uncharacterized protein n=1 Tax=Heterotrigona itama TaxID=395501 RepID=A0A6V7HC36_9HYME|nr:unnamed protein product [Heterotrigona itama]
MCILCSGVGRSRRTKRAKVQEGWFFLRTPGGGGRDVEEP